jgi:polar amino acid transport system substrate-binding protein
MKSLRISSIAGLLALLLIITPAVAQQSTLEEVQERGVLRAGVREDTPGFGFVDPSGEVIGFDVDLVREIARRLDVDVELVPVTASTRVPLLQQGRVDLLAATITHYRSRDLVIDFSIGYLNVGQRILVPVESGIEGWEDLAGRRVSTTAGAGVVDLINRDVPEATVQTFEGYPEAFLALDRGLVDAMAADVTVLAGVRTRSANPDNYTIVGETRGGGYFAIGLRENDSAWRDQINFILQDMWLDGTWDEIFNRWLGPETDFGLTPEDLEFEMTIWGE